MSNHSSSSVSSRFARNIKSTVVGSEEDLVKLKGRLFGEHPKLEVIPIVGMGGIGKTTLARYALDDPSTFHHFDVRAWVTVSQSYHTKSILLCILNSIDPSTKGQCTSSGTAYLVERVYKYLKGRRYLIVIDDIWNANVWDDVGRAFPDDLNGSRILITTRDLQVASYVDPSSHPHKMQLMDPNQSWRLLKEKVFGQGFCPPQLEKIGRKIAENCRGLPLAIVVISGLLCKVNQMQDAWEAIVRNVNEAVNTSVVPFAKILSLSYTCLPHYLRPCFLYMGGFPEDQEINVSKLIRLWAAEGFLRSNGSKDLEEVAEDYLEDLSKRSLVLINKKRYNGKIKTIKMHDLLRDLSLRRAREEKFLRVIPKFLGRFPEGIENSRRLCILSNFRGDFSLLDGSRIHTLLLSGICNFDSRRSRLSGISDFDSWKSFRLLRVLDAMGVRFKSYPIEVSELLYLRYLAIGFESDGTINKYIPESWSKLENLQTLIINHSLIVPTSHLPFGIWRMSQLRHVIVSNGFLPDPSTNIVAL